MKADINLTGSGFRIFHDFAVIFVLALILRLVFWSLVAAHYPEQMLSPDSHDYNALAFNILSGKGFLLDSNSPYYWYSILRTPVYPLFLAIVYSLTGGNYIWVGFFQGILSALTSALTYLIGQRLFGRRTGLIAGMLSAFSLLSIIYSSKILTEILFTILLVSSIWCIIKFWIRRSTRWLLVSAFLLGMAILCRPVALYYTLFLATLLIFSSQENLLQGAKSTVIFVCAVVLLVGSWVAHNWIVFSVPSLSGISSYNLVYFNAASLMSDTRGVDRDTAVKELSDSVDERLKSMGIPNAKKASWAQVLDAWQYVGSKVILQSPGRYISLHLRQDMKSLSPGSDEIFDLLEHEKPQEHGTLQVLKDKGILAAFQHYHRESTWLENVSRISTVLIWTTYALSLLGVAALVLKKQLLLLIILAGTVAYYLLLPGAPSTPRFRVPVEPIIFLLAAKGTHIGNTKVLNSNGKH